MRPPSPARALATAVLMLPWTSCASHPTMPTVDAVDLPAFMGHWYVQAHIPASSEAEAFNAIESYTLDDDHIDVRYVFRDGGFDAEFEETEMRAFVRDRETNATWGVEVFWPFELEYLVVYLSPDGSETIIGRTARDYAWIMTRTAEISEQRLDALVQKLGELGYDTDMVRRVPQRWPDPEHPTATQR